MQFYVGDWRKDPGVQSLSYHDRGVWFEMMCLMWESPARGKLILNGKPMPNESLARALGLDKQTFDRTLSALLAAGVPSYCETTGALINRRMVRDEDLRGQRTLSGQLGGNPKLTHNYNIPGFIYAITRPSDGACKIGIAKNPTKRIQKIKYTIREEVALVGVLWVEDMGTKEASLHKDYAAYNIGGEWFNLPTGMLNQLKLSLKGDGKGEHPPPITYPESESEIETAIEKRLHGIPFSVAVVIAYGTTLNPKVPEKNCRDFWNFYESIRRTDPNGAIFWVTAGENPSVITNWKAKLPSFGHEKYTCSKPADHREEKRSKECKEPPMRSLVITPEQLRNK